jgi:hypothetical protein
MIFGAEKTLNTGKRCKFIYWLAYIFMNGSCLAFLVLDVVGRDLVLEMLESVQSIVMNKF